MNLEDLGYNASVESYRKENNLESFNVGRVTAEHKDRYVVKVPHAEFSAELIGNLRFTAESRRDFPAVGDWVAFSEYNEGQALIHAIYPRKSIIERQAVGRQGHAQIIATNIDVGLIVQAVDRDFNLNRLERYLTICNASGVEAIVVLSKTDLAEESELSAILNMINERMPAAPVITVSSVAENGYQQLSDIIVRGKTYCLLGSSGVGKSTLANNLSGESQMKTGSISTSVNKGRHITSHRELIVLENGGILIDNPGMREVGIADTTSGLEITFDVIEELAEQCKFADCTHVNELGCAVLKALEEGELDRDLFNNYHKMQRERFRFEASIEEKRKKDRDLGKLFKSVKSARRKNKY